MTEKLSSMVVVELTLRLVAVTHVFVPPSVTLFNVPPEVTLSVPKLPVAPLTVPVAVMFPEEVTVPPETVPVAVMLLPEVMLPATVVILPFSSVRLPLVEV